MTCLQVAAKKLGLRKQDNTYGTCVPFVEQIFIPLANNAENETTEIMTCSKSQQMHWDHPNEMTPLMYANDTGQISYI